MKDVGDLESSLSAAGFFVFCECHTTRKTYRKDDFTIVLDEVVYPGFSFVYRVCEIELVVTSAEEMPRASDRILAFANEQGLSSEYVRGKVLEFLRREIPLHFDALVNAGVARVRSAPPESKTETRDHS
jgi:adenylate cyclase class IV